MSQGMFETLMCSYRQSHYSSFEVDFPKCWEDKKTFFEEEVNRVECAERDRKVDWSASKKIECYVDVIFASPTADWLKDNCQNGDLTCDGKFREDLFHACEDICPELDFHYSKYREVDGVRTKHRLKNNVVETNEDGDEETDHSQDSTGKQGRRCTRELDINFPDFPKPCPKPDPLPSPCTEEFKVKYYATFLKEDAITDLTGSDICLPGKEHTDKWAYNLEKCRDCGPITGRAVELDQWVQFTVNIGASTHPGKNCMDWDYPLVCGNTLNAHGKSFSVTVEGDKGETVCLERSDKTVQQDGVNWEVLNSTHHTKKPFIGATWSDDVNLECKSSTFTQSGKFAEPDIAFQGTCSCTMTSDNYIDFVFVDGKDRTNELTGAARDNWPAAKYFSFDCNEHTKMAIQASDAEKGCVNGAFGMICKSSNQHSPWHGLKADNQWKAWGTTCPGGRCHLGEDLGYGLAPKEWYEKDFDDSKWAQATLSSAHWMPGYLDGSRVCSPDGPGWLFRSPDLASES